VITGQGEIQALNREYRGKDRPTDVIAFYMDDGAADDFVAPPDGLRHLGEVVISYPQAIIQAVDEGHSIMREVTILVIHGVLHLLGYDDETPELKQQMSAREQAILADIEGDTA
jgi:probable rRNA maturation factor